MKTKILIAINGVLLASIILLVVLNRVDKEPTAYINLNEVYNAFELKKELEQKLSNTQNARKRITDSLEMNLNLLLSNIQTQGIDQNNPDHPLIQSFMQEQKRYQGILQQNQADNETLLNQYNEQIWGQLNQYIKDYGKSTPYEYILGTKGDGAIMYAKERNDISKEVIEYVNNAYHGKQ